MYNKRLANAGFYLLLLFAFMVSAWPIVSYYLALAIFLIWLADTLIFREVELVGLSLFYPILIFNVFLILAWTLSLINNTYFPYVYVGLFSLFYFIVPGFVMSGERRKMVLWSFIAGVVLASGFHLISWWDFTSGKYISTNWPAYPLMFQVSLAICLLIAFFAEAEDFREKLFLGFVSIAPALTALLTLDMTAIVVILFIVIVAGIFRDRLILIPAAIAIIILFSGIFGISYDVEKKITPHQIYEYILTPTDQFNRNHEAIMQPQFYGALATVPSADSSSNVQDSFLLNLLKDAGPPALIILLWIIIEQVRESFSRYRKVQSREARAHHLAVLLVLAAIIIMNAYSSAFEYPSTILASWMIIGMTEI